MGYCKFFVMPDLKINQKNISTHIFLVLIGITTKRLNSCSNFFVVEHILSPKFEVAQTADAIPPMEKVAIELLKLQDKGFGGEVAQVIHLQLLK